MSDDALSDQPLAREGYISIEGARLYYREIGQGEPIIILHGGPDFDHHYLLPEMDRLAGAYRLIYYDQRGRGRSAEGVRPEDVTLATEMADLDAVRRFFGFETVTLLGHSWGGLLAMEYAARQPERVARLILLNTGPASYDDYQFSRRDRSARAPDNIAQMRALAASDGYARGELEADAAYYRLHFRLVLRDPEQRERLVGRLRANVTPRGILTARAIEDRLTEETWWAPGYDLLPALRGLRVPTLILHGDYDFIPLERIARIAEALPGARLVVLRDCGRFAFLEQPDETRKQINAFFASA